MNRYLALALLSIVHDEFIISLYKIYDFLQVEQVYLWRADPRLILSKYLIRIIERHCSSKIWYAISIPVFRLGLG